MENNDIRENIKHNPIVTTAFAYLVFKAYTTTPIRMEPTGWLMEIKKELPRTERNGIRAPEAKQILDLFVRTE